MNQKFISSPSPTPLGDFFMLVLDYREIVSNYVFCTPVFALAVANWLVSFE